MVLPGTPVGRLLAFICEYRVWGGGSSPAPANWELGHNWARRICRGMKDQEDQESERHKLFA